MLEIALKISVLISVYVAGVIGTMVLLARDDTNQDDAVTDTGWALTWPLSMPLWLLVHLFKSLVALCERIRKDLGGDKVDLDDDDWPIPNLAAATKMGDAMLRVVTDQNRDIRELCVSPQIFTVLRMRSDFDSAPAYTPIAMRGQIRFCGIPVRVNNTLTGWCFYWKEKGA